MEAMGAGDRAMVSGARPSATPPTISLIVRWSISGRLPKCAMSVLRAGRQGCIVRVRGPVGEPGCMNAG